MSSEPSAPAPRETEPPAVSIVVSCFRRAGTLGRLVGGLATQTFDDFELILVDQTGESSIRTIAETAPVNARYLAWEPPEMRSRPRPGTPASNASGARNCGVLAAAAPIVAFTDDDCVPESDWVEKITLPLRTDPDVILCAGQNTAFRHPADTRVEVRKQGRQSTMITAATGGASSLAVRRDVFLELGGFDISIGPGTDTPGCEDAHLIYRFLDHAGRTGTWVAGRADAVSVDDHPDGLAALRRRWRYMVSQGAVWEREVRLYGDPVPGSIAAALSAESWRGIRRLRRGGLFWAVAGPMQAIALAVGRRRWRRRGPSRTNLPRSNRSLGT
ncbi:MAG: glycosyltransferase family 2 protein [Acidimicrobiia bacterium]|nr:glycosyltransferase family 2 protein [Acidimicrobiia bacterium]